MLTMRNGKRQKNGKNRTTKSGRKKSERSKKRKLIKLWNIGRGHHQTSGDKGNDRKRGSQTNEKTS